MPRSRIDLDAVIAAAVALIDAGGMEALTLSNVAEVLEVRPSALYTHVDGTRHLHYVVAVAATDNLTSTVRDAAVGVAGRDAVTSVAHAYHGFAMQHPGQYAATVAPPTGDDRELARASDDLLAVLSAVLRGLGIDGPRSTAAAVSMRSSLHGFLALGPVDGRPDDDGGHFELLLEMLIAGLAPRGR